MKWIVHPRKDPHRLPQFLEKKTGRGLSFKRWKRLLESHLVRVNGKVERFSSILLCPGDVVELLDSTLSLLTPTLLYEDADLSIWNKPAGILSERVCPSGFLAHRLDKPTSGALLLAKNASFLPALEDLFRSRSIQKEYIALVDGMIEKKIGYVQSRIRKVNEGVFASSSKGRLARTHYQVLSLRLKESLVLLRPLTGKTHQLRLHMQDLGHPILGDYHYVRKYRSSLRVQRLCLHAKKLSFLHPRTGERIAIEAPLLQEFSSGWQKIFPFP